MICEIICVDGFLCMLHLDIVHMLSAHYLGICILYTHYLQWSLICSFLTDNADVIHMSSLVLFIYLIMYNLVSALSAQTHIVCDPHVVRTCTHHLLVISNTPHIPLQLDSSPRNSKTQKVKETRLISQKVK